VGEVCGWGLNTEGMVVVPVNKENEAKGTVVREEVRFDRELTFFVIPLLSRMKRLPTDGFGSRVSGKHGLTLLTEFARVVRRAYEQPA